MRAAQRGISLIELVVVVAIISFLLAAVAPNFGNWISGMRVRSTAESMLAGLQLAKSEAASRNQQVRFQLTTTLTSNCVLSTTGTNWVIDLVDADGSVDSVASKCDSTPDDKTPPSILQVRSSAETNAGVRVVGDASSVVFNGFGRIVPAPTAVININVTPRSGTDCVGSGGGVTCLRIVIAPSGQVRMCNPSASTGDPAAC